MSKITPNAEQLAALAGFYPHTFYFKKLTRIEA